MFFIQRSTPGISDTYPVFLIPHNPRTVSMDYFTIVILVCLAQSYPIWRHIVIVGFYGGESVFSGSLLFMTFFNIITIVNAVLPAGVG